MIALHKSKILWPADCQQKYIKDTYREKLGEQFKTKTCNNRTFAASDDGLHNNWITIINFIIQLRILTKAIDERDRKWMLNFFKNFSTKCELAFVLTQTEKHFVVKVLF